MVIYVLYLYHYSAFLLAMNEVLKILQVSNSCVNVFIYAGMHSHFRNTILRLVAGRSWRNKFYPAQMHRMLEMLKLSRTDVTTTIMSSSEFLSEIKILKSVRFANTDKIVLSPCHELIDFRSGENNPHDDP